MAEPIRILIAHDHPMLGDGLRTLLESQRDFLVAGESRDSQEAQTITRLLEPDILALDSRMPGAPCFDVLRSLTALALSTRALLITASMERDDIVQALQLGVRGVVLREDASELLVKAIRAVMEGQYWIGRESVSGLAETYRPHRMETRNRRRSLTPRELEIISTVTSGYTNREIGRRFSLSEETVKHHLTKIFSKLQVSSRLELALFAISHRLAAPLSETRPKVDRRDGRSHFADRQWGNR